MAAADAPTLLGLLWLASPALPVGGFSYSEGLEAAVDAGLVHDEPSATAWLLGQLELGFARSDGPLLAEACRAWAAEGEAGGAGGPGGPDGPGTPGDAARIAALNAWQRTTRESEELRRQGEQMGRSLLDWLRNGAHAGDPRVAMLAALVARPTPQAPEGSAPSWPVAFALAATLAGAAPREALLACAFGWAENMAQAAMKAVPLGQAAAQRMLQALVAAIPPAVERALATGDDARQAFAPMLAILSARHETQYSRLFRS